MDSATANWVRLAQYDLATADAMRVAGRTLYVVFACQQAAEKSLKALVGERLGTSPPRTHDLLVLAAQSGTDAADRFADLAHVPQPVVHGRALPDGPGEGHGNLSSRGRRSLDPQDCGAHRMGSIAPGVKEIVRKYVAALRRLGVEPTRVLLFGSHARGTATPWSDIDLIVISPSFETLPAPDQPRILARANRELLAPIQALWATPEEAASASPKSFLATVLREAVEVEG